MAYLGEPFTHDVFISYSHGSGNQDGRGPHARWSEAFAKQLESEVRVHPSLRQYEHFLDVDYRPDRSVDPMVPLSDGLRSHIQKSAVLMVLMTPHYLESQWCKDERQWWCEHHEVPVSVDHDRIAVVRVFPTDRTWPPELVDSRGEQLVGFPFHVPVEGRNLAAIRPFGWHDMRNPDGEFSKALVHIAGHLSTKLFAIRERLEAEQRQQAETERLGKPDGLTIYLHGHAEEENAWQEAGVHLGDSGFVVLPGSPEPTEKDPEKRQEIREQRVETMSECDALLLLGTGNGRTLDHDLVLVGKHDRQSARARTNRLLPCGVVNTGGMSISTPIRKTNARLLQAHWLDAPRLPWTPMLRQWLAGLKTDIGAAP
ncbi:TIR domain-containing protein [Burkholderia sp. WP9]|uniref:TIR domain-containing protein n=1 Tax=Burkholderia sp. WP9 TaxID=1500263 RepID=UPI0008959244|nr:TIR domain-containing protein [Burkholderia sp. WP9]SED47035.1 TIR domain-containing protein [Burkholderia sp. WP9]